MEPRSILFDAQDSKSVTDSQIGFSGGYHQSYCSVEGAKFACPHFELHISFVTSPAYMSNAGSIALEVSPENQSKLVRHEFLLFFSDVEGRSADTTPRLTATAGSSGGVCVIGHNGHLLSLSFLHIPAQSGQLHANSISAGAGNRPVPGWHMRSMTVWLSCPCNRSTSESMLSAQYLPMACHHVFGTAAMRRATL